jgi:hypothetical protein
MVDLLGNKTPPAWQGYPLWATANVRAGLTYENEIQSWLSRIAASLREGYADTAIARGT